MTDTSAKLLAKPEVFAKYRIAVENGFRNEFSFIDYRRWGVLQVWNAGRFTGPPPKRQDPKAVIDVFLNYDWIAECRSNADANRLIARLLAESPVNLGEFADYVRM